MGVSYGNGGYARKVNYGWISESWELFKLAPWVWILGAVLYSVAAQALNWILQGLFPSQSAAPIPNRINVPPFLWHMFVGQLSSFGQAVSYAASTALTAFQWACLYRMAVKQVRGSLVEYSDLFNPGSAFISMLLFNLIYDVASLLGVCMCCIGVIFTMGLLLPGAALVADGEGPWRAATRSFAAMKGDWAAAGDLIFRFSLLYLLSMVPCFLGTLATMPMQHLISALAYRDMIGLRPDQPEGQVDYGAPQEGVWPPPPNMDGGGGQAGPLFNGEPLDNPPPGA